jgi:outer membrane lipoprotein SlyB
MRVTEKISEYPIQLEECIMKRKRAITAISTFVSIAIFFIGCAGMTPTQQGAVGGAAVGAIGGQIVGGNTAGTLIGAGVGALGGALLNDAAQKDKKK